MRRSSSRDSSDRVGNGIGRTLFAQADDSKLLQETQLNLFAGEQQQTIEHAHPYGFVNVPQPPDQAGGDGKTKGAEAFTGFVSGNRSHGVAFVVSDRRYRLYKLQNGEVALHDDQGHQVHISRAGVFVSAPKSKTIVAQIMADDGIPRGEGQQYGQVAQAGRQVLASYTMDQNTFTLNHPGTINLNAGGTINLNAGEKVNLGAAEVDVNAGTIVHNGITYLGSRTANKPIAMLGTIDTAGDADVSGLSTAAFTE